MGIKIKCWIFWIFFLLFASLDAQIVSQNRENQWYRVVNLKISPDGEWNLFYKLYNSGKSQAVLLNTKSKTVSIYEDPADFYLDNERFMLLSKGAKLQIKMLKSNTNTSVENVTEFHYYQPLESTFIMRKQQLQVIDRHLKVILSLEGVEKMRAKNDSRFAFFEMDHQPTILDIEHSQLFSLPFDPANSRIVHSDIEKKSVSVLVSTNHNLSLFTLNNGVITEKIIPRKYEPDMKFEISNEGILSVIRPYRLDKDSTNVNIEIWDSSEVVLTPKIQSYKKNAKTIDFIDLKSKSVLGPKIISDDNRPILLSGGRNILWVNDLSNESYTRNNVSPLGGLQLVDQKTQQITLKVEKANLFYVLKEKNALLYFSGKNWWIYDISNNENTNITNGLGTAFYTYERVDTQFPYPCSKAYFSNDFSKIYFTDRIDVWEYDLNTKKRKKITDSSSGIRYKIINSMTGGSLTKRSDQLSVITGNQLVLEVTTMDDRKKGLSIWKNLKVITVVEPTSKNIDNVQSSGNVLSFTQENANTPQKLFKFNLLTRKLESIFTSNGESYLSRSFPRSELIEWKDNANLTRAALVVLPPHYDRNKKYPVITNVYEDNAKEYLHFLAPSYYNGDGFNRTLMAMQDYIVILPKIYYTANQVGESAKESVEEAIRNVNQKYPLDFSNMGLIGHSFGGYETNYIMTHSKMFRTAISGSSLADITADYFTVHEQFLQSNISRYTNGTLRFSQDFYKNKNVYFENNPVFSADAVLAPLLLWTGKNDHHVNWHQSISMYMALASQKKEVKLMLFKNEAHTLMQKDNQITATKYFIDWFDHYLKGKKMKIK